MIALAVSCPYCRKSLMDAEKPLDGNPSIRVTLRVAGADHILNLSALYGSFRYDTPAQVDLGAETELFCPHCKASLVTDARCEVCKARSCRMSLELEGDVYFCSRRGCKNHKVELRDLEKALASLYAGTTK